MDYENFINIFKKCKKWSCSKTQERFGMDNFKTGEYKQNADALIMKINLAIEEKTKTYGLLYTTSTYNEGIRVR